MKWVVDFLLLSDERGPAGHLCCLIYPESQAGRDVWATQIPEPEQPLAGPLHLDRFGPPAWGVTQWAAVCTDGWRTAVNRDELWNGSALFKEKNSKCIEFNLIPVQEGWGKGKFDMFLPSLVRETGWGMRHPAGLQVWGRGFCSRQR